MYELEIQRLAPYLPFLKMGKRLIWSAEDAEIGYV
jgi:hypothetical protein